MHDTAFASITRPLEALGRKPQAPSYPPRPPEARQMPPVVQSLRRVTHLIAPVPRAAQSCLQRARERRRGHVVKGHVTRRRLSGPQSRLRVRKPTHDLTQRELPGERFGGRIHGTIHWHRSRRSAAGGIWDSHSVPDRLLCGHAPHRSPNASPAGPPLARHRRNLPPLSRHKAGLLPGCAGRRGDRWRQRMPCPVCQGVGTVLTPLTPQPPARPEPAPATSRTKQPVR